MLQSGYLAVAAHTIIVDAQAGVQGRKVFNFYSLSGPNLVFISSGQLVCINLLQQNTRRALITKLSHLFKRTSTAVL